MPIKLINNYYTISKDVLHKVLSALEENWFNGDRNNDDIIVADEALQKEVIRQQNKINDIESSFDILLNGEVISSMPLKLNEADQITYRLNGNVEANITRGHHVETCPCEVCSGMRALRKV